MSKPNKKEPTRCEYRYDAAHPAYKHLQSLAEFRDLPIQRLIDQAVKEWFVLTQEGAAVMPTTPSVTAPAREHDPSPSAGTKDVADEWL